MKTPMVGVADFDLREVINSSRAASCSPSLKSIAVISK